MKNTKIALFIIGCVVVLAISYGFFLNGSPATQRKRQLDQNKLAYLGQISSAVAASYLRTGQLPATLDELDLTDQDKQAASIKETDVSFRILSLDKFELCTMFETERQGTKKAIYQPDWEVQQAPHAQGTDCFAFIVTTPSKPY